MISVLRGLFAVFFVLFHIEHHKMYPFCNYLPEVNSNFKTTLLGLISYHLIKQLQGSKTRRSCWKKNMKGLKDKLCGS